MDLCAIYRISGDPVSWMERTNLDVGAGIRPQRTDKKYKLRVIYLVFLGIFTSPRREDLPIYVALWNRTRSSLINP